MSSIKQVTNTILNQVAPYIDEIVAYEFAEIDEMVERGEISLADADYEKKRKSGSLAKKLVGGAALGIAAGGAYAGRGRLGKMMAGAGRFVGGSGKVGKGAGTLANIRAGLGKTMSQAGHGMVRSAKRGYKGDWEAVKQGAGRAGKWAQGVNERRKLRAASKTSQKIRQQPYDNYDDSGNMYQEY